MVHETKAEAKPVDGQTIRGRSDWLIALRVYLVVIAGERRRWSFPSNKVLMITRRHSTLPWRAGSGPRRHATGLRGRCEYHDC